MFSIGISLMWSNYFYLYLIIGGEVIKKRRKNLKHFFTNLIIFYLKIELNLVWFFFGERHRCFDVIMPLYNYSGICD
jgi:hypothetical protein